MSEADPNRKLFVMAVCKDKQGAEAQAAREEFMMGHLDHVESILEHILVAGPIFADDGKTLIGSTLVYNTDDKEQAREWLEADPYFKAPIWESVEFHLFRGALGQAVGGVTYR